MSTFYFKRTHENHLIEKRDLTERALQRCKRKVETLQAERRTWRRREQAFKDAIHMLRADCIAACQDVDERDAEIARLRDAIHRSGSARRVELYLSTDWLGVVRTTEDTK